MRSDSHDHIIAYSRLCGHVVVECRCGQPFEPLRDIRQVGYPCHACAAESSRDEVQDLMDRLPSCGHFEAADAKRYRFLKWFFGHEEVCNVPHAFTDPAWFARMMERFPGWEEEARCEGENDNISS